MNYYYRRLVILSKEKVQLDGNKFVLKLYIEKNEGVIHRLLFSFSDGILNDGEARFYVKRKPQ
jgi:hypothetical protein